MKNGNEKEMTIRYNLDKQGEIRIFGDKFVYLLMILL